jgi:hypothetical protein
LLNFNEQNINQAALIAKIHRNIQNVKVKRGKNKDEFLASIFHVPTCTALVHRYCRQIIHAID